MPPSFWNRILRVNLTDSTIRSEEPGILYLRRYMGGWNIILDTLLREMPPHADALAPENRLVFAPGVITGVAVAGAARHAVGAKSPLSGGFGAGEAGGYWGTELKRAAFDAVIVEGASPTPVYLWIHDGEAELRDASHLWGKTTKDTLDTIKEELGDKRIRCASIGLGGENQVLYANIMHGTLDAVGRCGLGAVMGSKKLKSVVVRGTKRVNGADPDRLREMARSMAAAVKAGDISASMHRYGTGAYLDRGLREGNMPVHNFRDGEFDAVDGLTPISFLQTIGVGMEGCFACPIRCKKVVEAESPYQVDRAYGGPEYETLGALGTCCGVADPIAVSKASELCNAYSIDTIGTGVTIAFAMECFENGLLTRSDTDGLDLRFGNADAMLKMVQKIARREGLGDLLAQGTYRAAQKIGRGAAAFAMEVKNQAYPMHEPRLKAGLGISYAVSPTGADHNHAIHDTHGISQADQNGLVSSNSLRSLGILEPIDTLALNPGKVRATLYYTISRVTTNCVPVCGCVRWTTRERTELVRAATGWDVSDFELFKVGERALTLARVFNMREGLTADDDRLAERSHGPTRNGALSEAGIDRGQLHQAVRTYYEMAGWHSDTGVPLPIKLHELDVAWAIEHLPG